MPIDRSELSPFDRELVRLQETTVQAVLLQEPLPGGDRPVVLPDSGLLLRDGTVLLADENLAGTVSFADTTVPVRVLSLEGIREQARTQGDVACLHFQPAEIGQGVIRLTLQARSRPRT